MTRDGDKDRELSRDSEILTIEEVAVYLRLTPQTIYKWAQEKRIPAAKVGKERRFRKSIIDRWLDEQSLSSESGFEHLKQGTTNPPPVSPPASETLAHGKARPCSPSCSAASSS